MQQVNVSDGRRMNTFHRDSGFFSPSFPLSPPLFVFDPGGRDCNPVHIYLYIYILHSKE